MKRLIKMALLLGLPLAMATSCGDKQAADSGMTLSGLNPANFIETVDGKETALYVLKNSNGMEVCVTNFGGRIVSVMVPDKNGKYQDVVLGYDSIGKYLRIPGDFGASIGRYANRIANGQITLDGETIQLPQNNFGHCLHGGPSGWQYKVYDAEQTSDTSIKLTLVSPDGDNNFPGTVTAVVTYTLTEDNSINIEYSATTDKKTVINMTNHSYFNLTGDPEALALDHILYVNADNYTPVDSTFMTTGEIVTVKGTPFDFLTPKPIGQDIEKYDNEQIKNGNGYDHNWVLNTKNTNELAVRLVSPVSGITLEVYTDEPGIQVYTGNFLDGKAVGKNGKAYNQRASVCLETQHYPDSPNKPQWPSVVLEPGQTYESNCIFKFGVEK